MKLSLWRRSLSRYTDGDLLTATLSYSLGTGELNSSRMSYLTTRETLETDKDNPSGLPRQLSTLPGISPDQMGILGEDRPGTPRIFSCKHRSMESHFQDIFF